MLEENSVISFHSQIGNPNIDLDLDPPLASIYHK